MTISALFGVRAPTFGAARATVESALGIAFEERESSHRGGPYFAFEGEALQELFLQENLEVPEYEPAEEDFPDERFLLYVSAIPEDSPFLFVLEAAPELFAKLRMRTK